MKGEFQNSSGGSRSPVGTGARKGKQRLRTGLARTMLILLIFCVLMPSASFALQAHATPEEGLYSHQIGHLFFIMSMGVFAFWLNRTGLVRAKGWRYIQIGCLWLIAWNIDAMLGHHIESLLTEDAFVGKGWAKTLIVEKALFPYLYYFLKMDHLLCVPAMVFLWIGLKELRRESERGRP